MKQLGIDVTVVEMQPHVLLMTMDDDFVETIEEHIIDKGVKVFNSTQVTAFEGQEGHASGDCAEKKSFVTGTPSMGEFGTNAVFMAKVAAANILGNPTTSPGIINANASSAFEYTFGSAGLIAKMAEREGLDYVVGESEVMAMYPMMDGANMIQTKLVFD